MRQLVYTMFVSNNRPSFHLWWKKNLVKHRKVSKYYEADCSNFILFFINQKWFYFFFCLLVHTNPNFRVYATKVYVIIRKCKIIKISNILLIASQTATSFNADSQASTTSTTLVYQGHNLAYQFFANNFITHFESYIDQEHISL